VQAAQTPREAIHTRQEPQTLRRRSGSADPYALWLAEQARSRESARGEEVRWVYRYPRVSRPAAAAKPDECATI
jgi:hypothetical protein